MQKNHIWITFLVLIAGIHFSTACQAEEGDDACEFEGRLLGDVWGYRSWLCEHGVDLDVQSDDEVWRNVKGGKHKQWSYDGVLTATLAIDTEKLFGWSNGTFNVSWMNIRGRSISEDQLADYNPISGWEAYRSNRLLELWYEHTFLDGKLAVKLGQQALDSEFLISDLASLYLNANFGWPMSPSINLYSGGPSWPLASLGVRFQYQLAEQTSLLFAIANSNPTGHAFINEHDPSNQSVHPHGDNFNLDTGALFIGEVQQQVNLKPDWGAGLPGIYKIGGIFDTAHYFDQRWDKDGVPLSDPDSSGHPDIYHTNWILYAIADQVVWRAGPDSPTSIGIFGRVTKNPDDRNVVDLAVDAGINLTAPFPGRDEDVLGIGWGMGRTGHRARQADKDIRRLSGEYYPIRGHEYHWELTYRAQIMPWLTIQPDVQYISNPGGGVLKEDSDKRMHDEVVIGIHTNLVF